MKRGNFVFSVAGRAGSFDGARFRHPDAAILERLEQAYMRTPGWAPQDVNLAAAVKAVGGRVRSWGRFHPRFAPPRPPGVVYSAR